MQLLVLGANGPTGRLLARQAADAGHGVTAVTRHPETFDVDGPGIRVVEGDVLDPTTLDAVVPGHDAVVSALGVPYSFRHVELYSRSTENIIAAMARHDVPRVVCVSSSATDPATRFHDTGGGFFFERLLKPALTFTIGRTLYSDMHRMEELLAASDTDWTVVRPSGLFLTEHVTDYRTAPAEIRGRFTSRRDLADFLLCCVVEDLYVRQTAAIATFDPQPTVLQLMRQEALAGGR